MADACLICGGTSGPMTAVKGGWEHDESRYCLVHRAEAAEARVAELEAAIQAHRDAPERTAFIDEALYAALKENRADSQ
jgi:hypothetical protein